MSIATTAQPVAEEPQDLEAYCHQIALDARRASRILATISAAIKNRWLLSSADALQEETDGIIAANKIDIAAAPGYGLTSAAIDRLRLDRTRVTAIAQALREIAALPDPVGETIEGRIMPNGLDIRKVRVPIGTVFFIYESRPNVTADAAAICIKSGNAVVLRGGKEAIHSSKAIVNVLQQQAIAAGIPPAAIQLVGTTNRDAVGYFLKLSEFIDVAIPRGGKGLIERVTREASMPVIKHFDGNCHVYLDESADEEMSIRIVVNAKCQRMGVCNACESLIVHKSSAGRLLPKVLSALSEKGIEIRGCDATRKLFPAAVVATEQDWSEEYLGPIISVKVVDSLDDAIEHINRYSSHHTESIITRDLLAANRFQAAIDSAAVMVNASTRFNDGGEFGLGAEIGISTDKLHARGPCGLKELTTYKYLVMGNGQIRE